MCGLEGLEVEEERRADGCCVDIWCDRGKREKYGEVFESRHLVVDESTFR